jgi:hypothetical protein
MDVSSGSREVSTSIILDRMIWKLIAHFPSVFPEFVRIIESQTT